MSIVPKETVEVIAQSIGISNLSPDAALALAPDVEYRMREIMQEAIKCMHHSKRTTLTTDDVDSALNLRNIEPIFGFASGDPLRFRRALGHKDLFYVDDKDVDFKDVIEAPLPKAPLDTSIVCHWLAIEGVQPAIPENAPVEVITALPETKKPEHKGDELPVDIRLPVKHVLSRELQLYFNQITELTVSKPDSGLFKEALVSLATDSGLHPLIPYFTCFIADEVSRGLTDFSLLFAMMRVVRSLLQNPHIHIEPYLHQLMPSVVTCLVAKRLGNRFADNHWELRDFTANLVASICKRFGHVYSNLQTRLTKTLLHAFLDPKRSMTQHYGAIQGLAALGPNVVRLLILPNLETYLQLLEPEMLLEKQKNEMKRHEAWRVYGALLRAIGQCIYDRLKMFPPLPSAPAHAVWRTNSRVVTTSLTIWQVTNHIMLHLTGATCVYYLLVEGGAALPQKQTPPPPRLGPVQWLDVIGMLMLERSKIRYGSHLHTLLKHLLLIVFWPYPDSVFEIHQDKRKASAEELEQQPPLKKVATDGPMVSLSNNSLPSDMQVETRVPGSLGDSVAGPSTSSRNTPNETVKGRRGRRDAEDSKALRMSAILNQAWKDDLKSGHVLVSLFEQFGESIFSFIPTPEMSLFL